MTASRTSSALPTPMSSISYDPPVVAQKIATLQQALDAAGIALEARSRLRLPHVLRQHSGGEGRPARFSINGHGYLLSSFPTTASRRR